MKFSIVQRSVCLLMLSFLLYACGSKTFRSEEELSAYLQDEDNGYVQYKSVNGVDYSLVYRPTDLLVNQEIDSVSQKNIDKLRNKYKEYMHFILSMSKNGKELLGSAPNRQEFSRMVHQLSFGMGDKVEMYTAKDTLELLRYNTPRMFGMSPKTSVLFVYPRSEKYLEEDELFLKIEDFGLQTGDVQFKISTEKIKKQPNLSFGL